MTEKIKQEIEQLRNEIDHHNRLYYVQAAPEITDREFDNLLQRLIELESGHPEYFSPDSPSQKVGGEPIDGFQTVAHRIPMLSIDNVFDLEGLKEFDQRVQKGLEKEAIEYTVEYKIDGVALALIYENGAMQMALTRGDGREGDDITHNARTIGGVPLSLQGTWPQRLEVRGEAFISNSDFTRLRAGQLERGETVFANPRNSTAGALKLLDPKLCAQRNVRFLAHGIGELSEPISETHIEFLNAIKSMGLPITPDVKTCIGYQGLVDVTQAMMDQIPHLDFEVDGLVAKVNRLAERDRLGSTSKSPRWIIAYKWERYEGVTQVQDIRIQVGKTGTLTPVAELEPVEIAGTTVSRSSLHNREEIQRLDVRVGDWVTVEKAGKIIPHVIRVELDRRETDLAIFKFPEKCPECQTPVIQDEGGVYVRCPNLNCPARIRESVRYFASREAMDIEGLGIKLIAQLVEEKLIHSIADLYKLKDQREQLLNLERMGVKSCDKLLQGIEQSKTQPLWRLLTGLNIRHVGTTNAQVLARDFGSINALLEKNVDELAEIDTIGPVIADSLYEFLHSEYGQKLIDQLTISGLNLSEDKVSEGTEAVSTLFSGKTFVVTGALQKMTRTEIEELIRNSGGKASSSVSAKTDYLIAGEKAGSKLAKAQSLGVEILNEQAFFDRFQIDQ